MTYRVAQKSRTIGITLQLQFILQCCVDFLWVATSFAKITFSNSANAFGPDLGSSPTLPVFLNLLNSLPTVPCIFEGDCGSECLRLNSAATSLECILFYTMGYQS